VPAVFDPKFIIALLFGFFYPVAFYDLSDRDRYGSPWGGNVMRRRVARVGGICRLKQVPEIAALLTGRRLNQKLGNAFRDLASLWRRLPIFKIFSPDGVFPLSRMIHRHRRKSLGQAQAIAASVVKTGEAYTTVENGRSKPIGRFI